MNIERRSAIGLSVAALIGGAFTNVVGVSCCRFDGHRD